MAILVVLGVVAAKIYYHYINKYDDYRINHARELLADYERAAAENDFHTCLILIDSIEKEYNTFPHYRDSWEKGVLENYRSSVYLTKALFVVTDSLEKKILIKKAASHAIASAQIYLRWLHTYRSFSEEQIEAHIRDEFTAGLNEPEAVKEKMIKKRSKALTEAQYENLRRLSVSVSNLGICMRHLDKPLVAAKLYMLAVNLWEENLEARNNLHIIQGEEIEKRNILQQLFPPEKKKK